MTTSEKELRVKELESQIQRNITLYYKDSSKAILDAEFDSLVDELTELAPNSPVLSLMEDNLGEYPKVKLPFRLYSQKKIKNLTDFQNWLKDMQGKIFNKNLYNANFIITPKFDGIHLMQTGDNRFFTRGRDGIIGFEVTSRIKLFPFYKEGFKSEFNFGGELICSKENFEEYFRPQGYKSPRNLIQALFTNDEEHLPNHLDKIDYLRYSLYGKDYLSKVFQLEKCNEYADSYAVDYTICDLDFIKEERNLDNLFNTWKQVYNIDGLVIEFDYPDIRRGLGFATKYPQYSRAYKPAKYNQELKQTKIENIRYQVSRYGKIAPVAEVTPTLINDGIVTNVSLYNMRYMIQNSIHIGQIGYIYRSGAINPKFNSFIEDGKKVELPTHCPFCGSLLEWDNKQVDLYCENPECKEKIAQQIFFFFKTLKIKDFSLKSIRAYINEGGFNHLRDFLDEEKIQKAIISGIGNKTKDNFIRQIKEFKEKGIKLEVLQEASGYFDGLAATTLKILNSAKVDLEYLYKDSYYNYIRQKLISLNEIGDITADTYLISLPKFWEFYSKELSNYFPIQEEKIEKAINKIDLKVVFTGFRDEELKQKIEANGGKVLSSVSKNCDYVVCKDIEESSSKIKKALEFNIPLITKEEFISMLNEQRI